MRFTLKELAESCGGKIIGGDAVVTGVCADSRIVKPGDAFVALRAERDGNLYAESAMEKGAVCVISDVEKPLSVPVLVVEDTLLALGAIAKAHIAKFSPRKIAVTGSVGKTGTKEMVAAVIGCTGKTLKNEANFNNEIGLPLTAYKLDDTYKNAVFEMGMRGEGQISYLADIVKPEIGVITNVDVPHLELTGSLENTAKYKGELLDYLPETGTAVLNKDNEFFDYFRSRAKCNVISFGTDSDADVKSLEYTADETGCKVKASLKGQVIEYTIAAVGAHNVINSLAAAAAGLAAGMTAEEIRAGLEGYRPIGGRMEVFESKGVTVIDDTYNAAPPSVIAALKTLASFKAERRIAALGDMLELGEKSDALHKIVGEAAKDTGIDILICIGTSAKYIAEGAAGGKAEIYRFGTSDEAAEFVKKIVRPGDAVLAKGSHAIATEKIPEALK